MCYRLQLIINMECLRNVFLWYQRHGASTECLQQIFINHVVFFPPLFSLLPTSNVPLTVAGSTRDPQSVSSRIIFLSLLLLSLFVSTSYSAIIVSLLQTTSTAINSLRDLMDSPFTLSMIDLVSNMNYVNVSLLLKKVTTDKRITNLRHLNLWSIHSLIKKHTKYS